MIYSVEGESTVGISTCLIPNALYVSVLTLPHPGSASLVALR